MHKQKKAFPLCAGETSRVLRVMQRHCEFLDEALSSWAGELSAVLLTWSEDRALELADYLDKTSKSVSQVLEESLRHLGAQREKPIEDSNNPSGIRSRQVSKDTVLDFGSGIAADTPEAVVLPNERWKSCKIPVKKLTFTLRANTGRGNAEMTTPTVPVRELGEEPTHSPKSPLEVSKEKSKTDSSSVPDVQKYGTEDESKTSEERPMFVFTSQVVDTGFYSYRFFKFNNLSRVS